ncbi:MAG: hypothetical protein A4E28_02943 [Methanocella sp. PtaU1.Bin125]|nr:MAG: hypothetical protein A4E28_02943 [Methanocella sp. PtaU1.Bin125]
MRKFAASDLSLRWVQPHAGKRFFELRAGDDAVATLSWEKAFGTLATAQTADRTWTFKRVGVFNTRITVRSPGSDADLAVFRPGWGYGGTLEAWGRAYAWKKLDFWGNRWGFAGQDGAVIATFGYAGGLDHLFRLEGLAEVSPGTPAVADLPLLLTLGWYIMILISDDNAAIAGAVVATM